jgi:hypothetical protein
MRRIIPLGIGLIGLACTAGALYLVVCALSVVQYLDDDDGCRA